MRATELLNRFMKEFGWEALNLSFVVGQRFVWVFTGTYWQLRQSRKPENYDRSAQVMNIVARFKFDDYLAPAKRSDFILTHNRFEHPGFVLQDHVSLYHVNEKEAIFVEAPQGAELWRARYSPFFMAAQYYNAVRVIRMPIQTFYRLTDQMDDPKNVTFITNTARCGSTLLTQMFEATGKVVCLSEPSALNIMTRVAEEQENKTDIDLLIRRTVRMLCKPTKNKEVGYVLKLTGPAMPRLDSIARLFPQSKSLFMYRDFLKTTQSISRLSEELYAIKFIYWFGQYSSLRLQHTLAAGGWPKKDYDGFNMSYHLSFGILLSCISHKHYLRFRDMGLKIAAVRYEDVVADPIASMTAVLEFCGLPTDNVDQCRRSLEFDSQKGTPLSSERLRRHPTLEYAGAAKAESDAICDKFRLPHADQVYVAPGTITYRPERVIGKLRDMEATE